MKIVADSHIPYIEDYFGGYGELVLKEGRSIKHEDVKDADILIVRSITHVDEKLLGNSTVKFVGSVTAGFDHLDTKYLDQANILWSVAFGFNAPPVADYVLSVVASLQKIGKLPLQKAKVAVIGVGNTGRLVVERIRMLPLEISLCDPIRAQKETDFHSANLYELSDMDLITLHVPLTKTGDYPTYHFIDKNFLQRQKPGCVLLNASRGAVINSSDLLQYGKHLHWCFDVWEHEPHLDKQILEQSLIATPHIAGYSVQSKIRGIEMIYRITCDMKIIEAKPMSPIIMPRQRLEFSGQSQWQEIVKGVFNPLIITAMMRTLILDHEDSAKHFDAMRNQFNYRHELAYSTVANVNLAVEDQLLLAQWGVRVVETEH